MKLQSIIFCLLLAGPSHQIIIDTWSEEDFNVSQNCKDKSLMGQFHSNPEKCEQVQNNTLKRQLEDCKKKLDTKIVRSCPFTLISVRFIKCIRFCNIFNHLWIKSPTTKTTKIEKKRNISLKALLNGVRI